MKLWMAPLWLSIALTLALPSHAVDGVIEINDARALAGGVTPTDTAGYPVTIDQRGSYRLTGDLGVSGTNQNVVEISAEDVVLDLNGFTIRCLFVFTPCAGQGSGVGINISATENVVVRNGTVRDMPSSGIGGTGAVLENVAVLDNGGGGISIGGGTVRDSEIRGNTGIGIGFNQSEVSVIGSTIAGNSSTGIRSDGGVISGNTIAFNAAGIDTAGSVSALLIIDNVINNNAGFAIDAGANAAYGRNVLAGNNSGAEVQVSGTILDLGQNVCGTDLVCP